MSVFLTQIGKFMLVQSWQITLLVLIVAFVTFLLRNASAHVRYLLWLMVLAKCLIPPFYGVPLRVLPPAAPDSRLVGVPPSEMSCKLDNGLTADSALAASNGLNPPRPPAESEPAATRQPEIPGEQMSTWARICYALGLVWLIGMCSYLAFNTLWALRTHRWLRRIRCPLPLPSHQDLTTFFSAHGFTRLPKIWLADDVSQPFVWGLVRGSIYLPSDFLHTHNAARQYNTLAHELSHTVRFDAAVNLLQVLAQGMFWFHPFVWWTNLRIRREREKCCDEMAVAGLRTRPEEYGTAVLETLRMPQESARPIPSLAIAGPARNLEERIRTMMRPGKRFYRRPSVVVAMIVLALALITVPTALVLTVRAATEMDMVPPHRAASMGDIADVEQWLAQGGDVHVKNPAGETLLRMALVGGRLDIIQLLQKHGADIHAEIQNDPSLIRQVATDGKHEVADELISRGADTSHVYVAAYLGKLDQVKAHIESGAHDVSMADKTRILMGAITGGQADIIEYVLNHGANIRMNGLLSTAVRANRKQILELLIAKGADPNPGGSWSPLHITLYHYPRLEMAKVLLSHGADPYDQRYEDTWNPMHYAIDIANKDMVKLFLDHRRDTDLLPYAYYALKWGHKDVLPLFEPYVEISPIHLSCFYGKLDDARSYLEQGNDIEARDTEGLSLLQCAVLGSQMEIVDYLIAQGCNVNTKAAGGATALHCAANSKEMVHKLITAGALVEAKDDDDCTPFFNASDPEAAEVLLKHGADINCQRRSDGATALHVAASRSPYRNMRRMAWLIAHGADVNIRRNDGSTALVVAMNRDRLDAVKYLLEHGADVNTQNKDGMTPLYYAAWRGRKELVDMLLRNGADITVVNTYGRTAMGVAKERGYTEIAELLSKRARHLDPDKEIMAICDYAAIGNTEKIRSLIAAGHVQGEDGGEALSWASLGGHKEVAELLIQNGANVNHQGGNVVGWPLLHATARGNKDIVELLISNGAEVNVKSVAGDTALDIARKGQYTEIVELLQKHGATE